MACPACLPPAGSHWWEVRGMSGEEQVRGRSGEEQVRGRPGEQQVEGAVVTGGGGGK